MIYFLGMAIMTGIWVAGYRIGYIKGRCERQEPRRIVREPAPIAWEGWDYQPKAKDNDEVHSQTT